MAPPPPAKKYSVECAECAECLADRNVNVNPFGAREPRRGGAHIVVMNAGAVIFLVCPAGSILVSAFFDFHLIQVPPRGLYGH